MSKVVVTSYDRETSVKNGSKENRKLNFFRVQKLAFSLYFTNRKLEKISCHLAKQTELFTFRTFKDCDIGNSLYKSTGCNFNIFAKCCSNMYLLHK